MDKKSKNDELNVFYLNKEHLKQKSKSKNNRADVKSAPRKKEASKNKVRNNNKSKAFNFEDEIVIGVTKAPEKEVKNKTSKNTKKQLIKNKEQKTKKSKTNKSKLKPEEQIEKKDDKTKKQIKKKSIYEKKKSSKIVGFIIKWTILLSALVMAIIFFMMSPLFNIVEVSVINNEKINSQTILSLSNIKIGDNLYKTSSRKIEKNIEQNPYIENIKVSRKLPNKIELSIKERKTTYMLEYTNTYAYINNQGYILEISGEKQQVPIILGFTTKQEDIKAGNRLNEEDLERLTTVLKILESANGNSIGELVTKIDISNKQNYKLILEQDKKTVYIGEASNLSNKMLYLKAVLEKEGTIEGEIFLNGDLNKEKVFFREKI